MRKYDHLKLSRELLGFIEQCPSSFHAVKKLSDKLILEGYTRLYESDDWTLTDGGRYFVTRGGSSLIAFRYRSAFTGFHIAAAHSDSPCFKIKEKSELVGDFVRLNTEKYGGMICSTWLDRPLSVAGRVLAATEEGIEEKLVNVDKDLLLIPSVAIHMNRAANDGMKYNPAVDTVPLFGGKQSKGRFASLIAKEAGVKEESVLGADLFVYAREKGTVWGDGDEYISSRSLDDLQCVFSALKGFLAAKKGDSLPVLAIFDNEEVGSSSRQGAASAFLHDLLVRICGEQAFLRAIPSSFLLSCDNAHAVHPNHPEYCDPENKTYVNGGVVLKFNASLRYTTDGISEAFVKYLCRKKGIPLQFYANRSDIGGGSTLGNIAVTKVPICSADVGLPQLAMHSAYETAGTRDTACMIELCKAFYESGFTAREDKYRFI